MKKVFLIIVFFFLSNNLLADTLEYKDLEKLSKKNTFVDDKGKNYSIDDIVDKNNTLLIIYNHGSGSDINLDSCSKNPSFGYIWKGAVVPALLKLHNKKIKGLEIKIYRLCSGVKGMSLNNQKKYRKQIKSKGKIDLVDEFKNIKRQNIILDQVDKLKNQGFKNIILAGYSAGGWASLNLQSRYPNIVKGAIAFNPAFAGPKKEWQKKYPEWGAFRAQQVDIFNKSENLNAILFAHDKDIFEDPDTLSFFKKFKGMNFIDYSELKPSNCRWADVDKKMGSSKGHNIPQSICFTNFIKDKNYLLNFLNEIF